MDTPNPRVAILSRSLDVALFLREDVTNVTGGGGVDHFDVSISRLKGSRRFDGVAPTAPFGGPIEIDLSPPPMPDNDTFIATISQVLPFAKTMTAIYVFENAGMRIPFVLSWDDVVYAIDTVTGDLTETSRTPDSFQFSGTTWSKPSASFDASSQTQRQMENLRFIPTWF